MQKEGRKKQARSNKQQGKDVLPNKGMYYLIATRCDHEDGLSSSLPDLCKHQAVSLHHSLCDNERLESKQNQYGVTELPWWLSW